MDSHESSKVSVGMTISRARAITGNEIESRECQASLSTKGETSKAMMWGRLAAVMIYRLRRYLCTPSTLTFLDLAIELRACHERHLNSRAQLPPESYVIGPRPLAKVQLTLRVLVVVVLSTGRDRAPFSGWHSQH